MSKLTAFGLRAIMLLTFLLFLVLAIAVVTLAAFGEFEALEEMFEETLTWNDQTKITPWRIVLCAVFALFFLYALGLVFLAVHKLLRLASRADMASPAAAITLRRMGRGMVLLWFAIVVVDGIFPYFLLSELNSEIDWEISFIGVETVYLICGAAIWIVASLADEANALKEEMAGVV